MKKLYAFATTALMAMTASAQNQPQIANGDFEDWSSSESDTKIYAPDGWNSFETADGGYASMVKAKQVEKSTDVRPGSTGQYSALISARMVNAIIVKVPAQGNLTTGRIHAGAANTSSSSNYNYSDVTTPGKFNCPLGAKPDSVAFWVKFVPGAANLEAKFSAIIHDNYNYISYGVENAKDTVNPQHLVAEAVKMIPDNGGEWVRYCIPFEYTGPATEPDFIQVNFSTNGVPGKGTATDKLYVDDIELIYKPTEKEDDNPTSGVKGDINGDGKVTINDITDLIEMYLNSDN